MAHAALIWVHVTLVVAAVWLFIRVKPIALVVAIAIAYMATIMVWLVAIRIGTPQLFVWSSESWEYPLGLVTSVSLITGYLALSGMRRRARQRIARESMTPPPPSPDGERDSIGETSGS